MFKKISIAMIVILSIALVVTTSLLIRGSLSSETNEENQTELIILPATIRGRVYDDYGHMVTAGIIIENVEGNLYRVNTNVLSGYTLRLPAGTYQLHFTRGMEYSIVTKTIVVENFKTYLVDDVRLVRRFDSSSFGYYPGDIHQHSTWSDGADSVDQVALSNVSNGLRFGFLTDHNSAAGLAEWMQANRLVANISPQGNNQFFSAFLGNEVTTVYGHFNVLGSGIVPPEWDIDVRAGDDIVEELLIIIDEIKRSGAVAQLNHPFSYGEMGFNHWELIEQFDTYEIWNGKYQPNRNENLQAKTKWFELLNEGIFLPITGSSDNHSIQSFYNASRRPANPTDAEQYRDDYLRLGLYSGVPAYYAYIPDGTITLENVQYALLNGHAFVSNGILLFADIEGVRYGNTYSLGLDTSVDINLTGFCREGIDVVYLIVNGEVAHRLDLDGVQHFEEIVTIDIEVGDWLVIEAEGPLARYVITNPIFID